MNCVKVKYSSEADAIADMDRIRSTSARYKKLSAVYLCRCGAWHLTSKPKYTVVIARQLITIEMLTKANKTLKNEILSLKTCTNKQERHEVKVDAKVQQKGKQITKAKKIIKHLRRSLSESASRIVELENKLKEQENKLKEKNK